MSIHSIMWLLPVVFMLHDFEEIIMMRAFLLRWPNLEKRLPGRFQSLAHDLMKTQRQLSTAGFSLAVACIFFVLSTLTLLSIEFGWNDFFAGVLAAFGLHLVMHISQYLLMRRYVPVIITSLPGLAYSVYALWAINRQTPLDWTATGVWAVVALFALAIMVPALLRIAILFDRWLVKYQGEGQIPTQDG